MITAVRLALAFVLLIGSAACSAIGGGPIDAMQGEWVFTDGIAGGAPISPIDGVRVTLKVDGTEVSGTAACNGFSGSVEATATGIRFRDLFQTLIGCDQPIAALEAAFMEALQAAEVVDRQGDTLTLRGTDLELRFVRRQPEADAPLTGTTWTLDYRAG
ncbi:MAG TPA: META domain-containing protein [Candidatus Limnocylindria bacterium]|nr:META domain-containing protein [Candidatus Limnocylindria bacterium]